MTPLLARLGHFDTRRAVQTIVWNSGKPKQRDWICCECRAKSRSGNRRPVRQQRRQYSDASFTLPRHTILEAADAGDDASGNAKQQSATSRRSAASKDRGVPEDEHERTPNARMSNAFFSHRSLQGSGPKAAARDSETEMWEQFEMADDAQAPPAADTTAFEENTSLSVPEDEMLNLDYKNDLLVALSRREADRVIRCLFSALRANDMGFIYSIPDATFTQIIQLLEPSNFVVQLGNSHIELSSALVELMGIAPMREIAYEYSNVLRRIARLRRSAGAKLSLVDYTTLLQSARDLGSCRMAQVIWSSMLQDEVVPDTKCYNFYMASVVWNGIHNAGARQKFRVTPFHLLARSGHLVGASKRRFSNFLVGQGGAREVVRHTFNKLLASGNLADQESFRALITACAREGDLDTVKAVLRKVWRIDVAALLEGQDEATILPRPLADHSPLRPTSRLLFTIAHAFGINNDIPTALRLVDFVARSYNLAIAPEVWDQLFEWTFVLSHRRSATGSGPKKGTDAGALPRQSVWSLWNTMTGAPYFVNPTMGMYNRMIKALVTQGATPDIMEKMDETIPLFHRHKHEAKKAQDCLTEAVRSQQAGRDGEAGIVERARKEWEHRHVVHRRDVFWRKRWVRLLLSSFRDFYSKDHGFERTTRDLPSMLWEWRHFTPASIRYETVTGWVEFSIKTELSNRIFQAQSQVMQAQNQEVLEASRRYVGNEWVLGRKEDDAKREETILRRESTSARRKGGNHVKRTVRE